MPAPLETPWTFVKWRVDTEDLELLRSLFPGKVNEQGRNAIHAYCEALRAKGFGDPVGDGGMDTRI